MNNYLKGEKRTCPCGELKFFDFNRLKLECPRCKKDIIIEALDRKPYVSKNAALQINNEEKEFLETPDKEDALENIENNEENVEDLDISDDDDNSTIVNIEE